MSKKSSSILCINFLSIIGQDFLDIQKYIKPAFLPPSVPCRRGHLRSLGWEPSWLEKGWSNSGATSPLAYIARAWIVPFDQFLPFSPPWPYYSYIDIPEIKIIIIIIDQFLSSTRSVCLSLVPLQNLMSQDISLLNWVNSQLLGYNYNTRVCPRMMY